MNPIFDQAAVVIVVAAAVFFLAKPLFCRGGRACSSGCECPLAKLKAVQKTDCSPVRIAVPAKR